jgi:hypothetical protein
MLVFVLAAVGGLLWQMSGPAREVRISNSTKRSDAPMALASDMGGNSGKISRSIASSKKEEFPDLLTRILSIEDDHAREIALDALFSRWMKEDLVGLGRILKGMPMDDPQWPRILPALTSQLARETNHSTLDAHLSIVISHIAAAYATFDANGAMAWARQNLAGDQLDTALEAIVRAVAAKSPDTATSLLSEIHNSTVRDSAVDDIGAALGTRSPELAYNWVSNLPEELRSQGVEAVLSALVEKDPRTAQREFLRFRAIIMGAQTSDASSTSSFETLDDVAARIASGLAASGGADAINWANSLPSPALQKAAVQGALAGWAAKDPENALTYVERQNDQDGAETVFEKWASAQPERAALEAQSVNDPQMRERAVAGLLSGVDEAVGTEDLPGWVDSLPTGTGRDALSEILIHDLADSEPDNAWRLADGIGDPTSRMDAFQTIVGTTAEGDPEAARRLVSNAHNLSSAEAASLLALIATKESQSR